MTADLRRGKFEVRQQMDVLEKSRMKIAKIETFRVRVPLHPISWHNANITGWSGTWWDLPVVLLRMTTDSGLSGLGEAPKGVAESAIRQYAPLFKGRDPFELNWQHLPIGDVWSHASGAYQAYETALYDLVGKALELPVYQLLGGAYRSRVRGSLCSGQMWPDDAARRARQAAEMGIDVLKMKANLGDPVVERISAINKAVGTTVRVTVDAGEHLQHPRHVLEIARGLEPYLDNIECFEDPVSCSNLDWYVLLREKLDFPLALHLGSHQEVINAVKREACDYLNLGRSLNDFKKGTAIAKAAGMPVWHGSGVGLGISEASHIHACAATKATTLSSDIVGEMLRVDDLIVRPLEFEEGYFKVPQEPGLGVELDEEALERFGVR